MSGSKAYQRRRQRLVQAEETCHYCGSYTPLEERTADHKQPRRFGGHSRWKNLVMACRTCNTAKGAMTAEQFMKHRRTLITQLCRIMLGLSYRVEPQSDAHQTSHVGSPGAVADPIARRSSNS